MDLFDILWLVICIGLPVISGIAASAEKKKKAQGRPVVTQEPEEKDLPSWMEILTGQPMEAESVDEVPEEQMVVEEVVPAAENKLEAKPAVVAIPAKKHCSDAIADGAIGEAEPKKRIDKERIDPEKLVVYTAIMNPKFNEY